MTAASPAQINDALVVADDAAGYPLDVLVARLALLEGFPAIRRQLVDEIARRALRPTSENRS